MSKKEMINGWEVELISPLVVSLQKYTNVGSVSGTAVLDNDTGEVMFLCPLEPPQSVKAHIRLELFELGRTPVCVHTELDEEHQITHLKLVGEFRDREEAVKAFHEKFSYYLENYDDLPPGDVAYGHCYPGEPNYLQKYPIYVITEKKDG